MSDRFVLMKLVINTFFKGQIERLTGNKIKQRQGGTVVVNDQHVTKHNHELNANDRVEVLASGKNIRQGIEKQSSLSRAASCGK